MNKFKTPVADSMKHDPILPPNPQDISWEEELKKEVLKRLGKPPELLQITACNLWDNRWRVNVWTNKEIVTDCSIMKSPTIAKNHSFFCIIKQGGEMVFNPPIKRLYESNKDTKNI